MKKDEKVLKFFHEISKIPRKSGDEKAISEYLVRFANERGLEAYTDDYYNVIIKKPSTVKNCNCAPVIIQGHTDMVYVQDGTSNQKYEDGLKLIEKDGWMSAEGTSLGADDGIAVAYALALLDSDDIEYPDLEAVFTVSEEVGLIGAQHLDYSLLKGKYLINLDTEEEGIFFTSCAGAVDARMNIPLEFVDAKDVTALSLEISGLSGGHSGAEIHKGKANAIVLLGRVLKDIENLVKIKSLFADGKTNIICNNAKAELYVDNNNVQKVCDIISNLETDFINEQGDRDDVHLDVKIGKTTNAKVYSEKTQANVIRAITLLPFGVLGMSFNIQDLVETSANVGYLEQENNTLSIITSARSSVGSRKRAVKEKYKAIADLVGAEIKFWGDYPQWEYRENSYLRDLAMNCYREQYGNNPKTCAIHAGLECGYFDYMLDEVDIISIGPNIDDIHSPREKLEIKSTERVWELLQRILKKLANG